MGPEWLGDRPANLGSATSRRIGKGRPHHHILVVPWRQRSQAQASPCLSRPGATRLRHRQWMDHGWGFAGQARVVSVPLSYWTGWRMRPWARRVMRSYSPWHRAGPGGTHAAPTAAWRSLHYTAPKDQLPLRIRAPAPPFETAGRAGLTPSHFAPRSRPSYAAARAGHPIPQRWHRGRLPPGGWVAAAQGGGRPGPDPVLQSSVAASGGETADQGLGVRSSAPMALVRRHGRHRASAPKVIAADSTPNP